MIFGDLAGRRFIGAGDDELSLLEHHVLLVRLHGMGSELFPLAMTLSAAASSAVPAAMVERDPNVPVPVATRSVSPCWKRTRSGGIPGLSAMIWRNDVAWPWPWSCVPSESVSAPDGSKRSSACSISPTLVDATVLDTPIPRSLPCRSDCARRAGKPS